MLEIDIPGRGSYRIDNLVLDMNGTIALDGNLDKEVAVRIGDLSSLLDIYVITAGTHGKLSELKAVLGTAVRKIEPPEEAGQKRGFIEELGKDRTAGIGNGANDALMLKQCAVGIAVIGGEGAAIEAILSADVVVGNISEALDLLLKPMRLVATLRK
jgi:soluble P-type ATPase